MDLLDLLKVLSLDTWYKVVMWLGAGVLVASLFFQVHGDVTNAELQTLSLGIFLLGLGEWKNHKSESWIKPPNAYTGPAALMSSVVRSSNLVGVILQIAGASLTIFGICKVRHWIH